ncbi:hypothetical protein CEXT_413051 [Caerostris extrusa]|uniref:Uncharacterized protein n=1 Tax=Caerostris extrusa TaxID=172846 RepID=A0AAV4N6N7_CAEEX|nr:hypothetical protein CEXT_413051 [Caerostris extrusa]
MAQIKNEIDCNSFTITSLPLSEKPAFQPTLFQYHPFPFFFHLSPTALRRQMRRASPGVRCVEQWTDGPQTPRGYRVANARPPRAKKSVPLDDPLHLSL